MGKRALIIESKECPEAVFAQFDDTQLITVAYGWTKYPAKYFVLELM